MPDTTVAAAAQHPGSWAMSMITRPGCWPAPARLCTRHAWRPTRRGCPGGRDAIGHAIEARSRPSPARRWSHPPPTPRRRPAALRRSTGEPAPTSSTRSPAHQLERHHEPRGGAGRCQRPCRRGAPPIAVGGGVPRQVGATTSRWPMRSTESALPGRPVAMRAAARQRLEMEPSRESSRAISTLLWPGRRRAPLTRQRASINAAVGVGAQLPTAPPPAAQIRRQIVAAALSQATLISTSRPWPVTTPGCL